MEEVTEHRLLDRMGAYLDRWPAPVVRMVALLAIPLFGLFDYLSGPDIAFSVFYLVPLAVLGWVSGRDRVLVGTAAVLAAQTWLVADLASGGEYERFWVPVWNTATRLAVFLIVVSLLANLRDSGAAAERLARLDHLTGVSNSRTFFEAIEKEIVRSRRTGRPISLAYIDVDDFKAINDTRGHAGGDQVLQHLAAALDASTRAVDVVGRLGGDEFAILLPETTPEDATRAVKAIEVRVSERAQELGFPVTFSLGCVTFMRPPADPDEVIRAADEMMYEAKHGGKNRSNVKVVDEIILDS